MERYYKFNFEGCTYYGTVADKNEFLKHATKAEKAEYGKIISKERITKQEVEEWRLNAMCSLGL